MFRKKPYLKYSLLDKMIVNILHCIFQICMFSSEYFWFWICLWFLPLHLDKFLKVDPYWRISQSNSLKFRFGNVTFKFNVHTVCTQRSKVIWVKTQRADRILTVIASALHNVPCWYNKLFHICYNKWAECFTTTFEQPVLKVIPKCK